MPLTGTRPSRAVIAGSRPGWHSPAGCRRPVWWPVFLVTVSLHLLFIRRLLTAQRLSSRKEVGKRGPLLPPATSVGQAVTGQPASPTSGHRPPVHRASRRTTQSVKPQPEGNIVSVFALLVLPCCASCSVRDCPLPSGRSARSVTGAASPHNFLQSCHGIVQLTGHIRSAFARCSFSFSSLLFCSSSVC